MDERARMQEKMASIGERYLRRTLGETPQLIELLAQLRAGAPHARKDLALITHRIHGSGAMFGFAEVSERAHRCELLCAEAAGDSDHELAAKLEPCLQALEECVRAAARARGVEE